MSRRRDRQRGVTLVEILIASTLFTVMILIVNRFYTGARRMEQVSGDVTSAMRSVMLATEFIRFDLGRALTHSDATKLSVNPQGAGFTMSISGPPPANLEQFNPIRVQYYTEPAESADPEAPVPILKLLRRTATSLNYIKECWLTSFKALNIPIGVISDHQAYLEITLEGTDYPHGKERYISSQLIPYVVPQEPAPYVLLPAGGRP